MTEAFGLPQDALDSGGAAALFEDITHTLTAEGVPNYGPHQIAARLAVLATMPCIRMSPDATSAGFPLPGYLRH